SDWGDVIRLSGARYGAGPDLKSRFGEPSAPESLDEAGRQEMNPISWCLVLRETYTKSDAVKTSVSKNDSAVSDIARTAATNTSGARIDSTIPRPATYHAASFAALDKTPPWVDSDMSGGIYSQSGWSIYTHRRLVDRWHFDFSPGTEATFLNWPVQDYPLCQLPQRVVDALERLRPGASRLNIVDLAPRERQVIFDDARQHALGLLHHLQTAVHDRVGDFPQSFRYLQLTDEFGTPDRLPPKPYVREGLRLEALTMLREQDIRAATREPKWAKTLPSDSVFGFQFNIDFHPTRRKYLTDDRNGPWQFVHTPSRNWHTDTDRAVFPLRGLVPVATDGLLGGGKNIGVSSIVQSALRLHGQMMHVGQASGTIAALCLREQLQPRDVAAETRRWREVQRTLVRGRGGPGVLLWPWHDVAPADSHFEAANMLAVRNIWPVDPDSVFFHGDRPLTRRELARTLDRLLRHLSDAPAKLKLDESTSAPRFTDVPADDVDRAAIESLIARGKFGPQRETFQPDAVVNWGSLHRWLVALDLPASPGLVEKDRAELPLTRAEAARHLWRAADLIGPP
ncbi:MAG TPA: FAD-dependent oxidoreductase, partial [Pirellulaceae bacterium]|nr:FAD-dependent oxidoreductase [Pirellulaceae bacterium]